MVTSHEGTDVALMAFDEADALPSVTATPSGGSTAAASIFDAALLSIMSDLDGSANDATKKRR